MITFSPDPEAQLEQAGEALQQLPDDVREQINLDLGELELAVKPGAEQDGDQQENREQTWFDSGANLLHRSKQYASEPQKPGPAT